MLSLVPLPVSDGKLLMPSEKRETIVHGDCELVEFSAGHALCGPPPPADKKCDDHSFDKTLAEK
ncbi:hypothetical protein ACHAXH_005842 [Discostella pseudostelligera]|jgi:hypothetical protein